MTDPSINLVNIKHNAKELQEHLANAQKPSNVRLAEILVICQEILEDAQHIKAWAIDKNLEKIND